MVRQDKNKEFLRIKKVYGTCKVKKKKKKDTIKLCEPGNTNIKIELQSSHFQRKV